MEGVVVNKRGKVVIPGFIDVQERIRVLIYILGVESKFALRVPKPIKRMIAMMAESVTFKWLKSPKIHKDFCFGDNMETVVAMQKQHFAIPVCTNVCLCPKKGGRVFLQFELLKFREGNNFFQKDRSVHLFPWN